MEKKFRTKTGYCHILPDKLVLTRSSIIGDVSKVVVSKNVYQILVINILIAFFLAYATFQNIQTGQIGLALLWGCFSIYFLITAISSWTNSATPIIHRHQIKEVTFHTAKRGFSRAYFTVKFHNEKGDLKKRLIMLPGSLNNGAAETELALQLMENEGLISHQ